jgi:predicted ATPase
MKIKSVYCKGFKRFTELLIDGIPIDAKLVCLVGPNGTGKSSLFDLFNYCIQPSKHGGGSFRIDYDYHSKVIEGQALNEQQAGQVSGFKNIAIHFHDHPPINENARTLKKEMFYIRSGYRHEADVKIEYLRQLDALLEDSNRPETLMAPDERVSDNYMRIVADSVESVFSDRIPDASTKAAIRDRLIGRARESLSRLFPTLVFEGVGNPLDKGTFYFTKGRSKHWKYKNLSAGEKAAFDLLLDFAIKTEAFTDTTFCIDEPELHMHSELQSRLLEELYNITPPKCQLWIATHSIGMMRKAKELSERAPGSVVLLDFEGHDFDEKVELAPAAVNRLFWKKTFSVAIGDLADLLAPSQVVFCEGSQSAITGARSGEFDARCFNRIFGTEFPDVEFVSLGGASEVEKNSLLLTTVFRQVVASVSINRVVDKDDRSESELHDLSVKGIRVLSKRHIESFLFDDEILVKLCNSVGKPEKLPDIQAAKSAALADSIRRGNPVDDFKSMSPKLYTELKRILQLTRCGSSKEAFCIDTLAPLITPETAMYQQLKRDVFA